MDSDTGKVDMDLESVQSTLVNTDVVIPDLAFDQDSFSRGQMSHLQ